jgi:hypothetical protein
MDEQTSTSATRAQDASAPTPVDDNSLAWTDARLLGFTPMDDVHEEFYATALKLVTCTEKNAAQAIRTVRAACHQPFRAGR